MRACWLGQPQPPWSRSRAARLAHPVLRSHPKKSLLFLFPNGMLLIGSRWSLGGGACRTREAEGHTHMHCHTWACIVTHNLKHTSTHIYRFTHKHAVSHTVTHKFVQTCSEIYWPITVLSRLMAKHMFLGLDAEAFL